jgi:hypothetical protein
MKTRQIRLLVIAGVLTLAAAIAVSQTVKRAHMHGGGMFGEHQLQFFTDYLDLTDASAGKGNPCQGKANDPAAGTANEGQPPSTASARNERNLR